MPGAVRLVAMMEVLADVKSAVAFHIATFDEENGNE